MLKAGVPSATVGAFRPERVGRSWAGRSRVRWSVGALGALLVICSVGSAGAQMQLPGAVNGGAGGSGASESQDAGGGATGAPPYVPPRPVVISAPDAAAIAGHPLSHDGAKGEMLFEDAGGGLALTKLTLAGDKISKPGQACAVNVVLPTSLAATLIGRPAGTNRYSVPLQNCPYSVDVLDGAALVTSAAPTCEFSAADCRVSLGGLWGPRAADITPKRAKDLERERVRLETTMRANFHALLRKAGKDRVAVKRIAKEQAAFSSEREMTCRDYEQETAHGFCSTQITEARTLALLAQFGPIESRERKTPARARPRIPVAPAPAPAPSDQGER